MRTGRDTGHPFKGGVLSCPASVRGTSPDIVPFCPVLSRCPAIERGLSKELRPLRQASPECPMKTRGLLKSWPEAQELDGVGGEVASSRQPSCNLFRPRTGLPFPKPPGHASAILPGPREARGTQSSAADDQGEVRWPVDAAPGSAGSQALPEPGAGGGGPSLSGRPSASSAAANERRDRLPSGSMRARIRC